MFYISLELKVVAYKLFASKTVHSCAMCAKALHSYDHQMCAPKYLRNDKLKQATKFSPNHGFGSYSFALHFLFRPKMQNIVKFKQMEKRMAIQL